MASGCVSILRCFSVLVLVLLIGVYSTSYEIKSPGRDKRQITETPDVSKVPSPLPKSDKGTVPPAATKKAKGGSDKGDKATVTVSPAEGTGSGDGPMGVSPSTETGKTNTTQVPGTKSALITDAPTEEEGAPGIAAVPQPTAPAGPRDINFTLEFGEPVMYIHEGEAKNLTIVYSGALTPLVMHLKSSDESMFTVASNDTVFLEATVGEGDNSTVIVTLRGIRLGITTLQILILDSSGTDADDKEALVFKYLVKTKRVLRVIDTIFDYMLLPLVLIATCGMGCKLDTDIIKGKLRRPIPVFVGPVCQFICMPLVALSISKLLQFDPLTAMGLITVGSCPGGGLSNMITLLVDADLIMSVTMTFLSTCLALGMLPLNLFIYSRFFKPEDAEEGGINLPITNIIMQISFLTVPLLLGMLIRAKLPKVAYYAIKSLNVLALTLVILTLGIGLYSNTYIVFSPGLVILGGFLHPSFGFIIGFIMAKFIARFPSETAVTVSIETGVQNNLIAISMLKLSYDQPEADIMARMPMIVAISAVSEGIGMILASIPINRRRRRNEKRAKALKDVTDKYDYQPVELEEKREGNGAVPSQEEEEVEEDEEDKKSVPSYDIVVVEQTLNDRDGRESVV